MKKKSKEKDLGTNQVKFPPKILKNFFGEIGRKQKAREPDFEELSGIVCWLEGDTIVTIVSYNNALFLQRERNPADLAEPLFGSRCSIIRSDLRHCSTFRKTKGIIRTSD